VIEGSSQVPAGGRWAKDEFLELDENSNPLKKSARSAPAEAPATGACRRPANTANRGTPPAVASVAAEPEEGIDAASFTDTGEAAPRSATASAGRSRTGTGNPPSRGRGGGGPRRG
jgi:hypothetical protein